MNEIIEQCPTCGSHWTHGPEHPGWCSYCVAQRRLRELGLERPAQPPDE